MNDAPVQTHPDDAAGLTGAAIVTAAIILRLDRFSEHAARRLGSNSKPHDVVMW